MNARRLSNILGVALLAVSSTSIAANESGALDCLIEPSKTVDVSLPVEGVVSKLHVERGDYVAADATLVELRSDLEIEAVKLAKSRFEFGIRSVKRNVDLYKKNLISIHEKDELETDTEMAALELEQAQTRLKMRTVHAPISGFVTDVHISAGEFVSTEPVVTLVSIDPLFVEVVAPIDYLGKVKAGDEVTVVPEAPMDQEYAAKVRIVDPIVDAASGTFRIRLEIANEGNALPSGLKCIAKF